MQHANNDFQPKELDFTKYVNTVPFLTQKEAFRAETKRIHQLFRSDAIEAVGLTGHPKADEAFELAYEYASMDAGGSIYQSTFFKLQDMANLIRGLK